MAPGSEVLLGRSPKGHVVCLEVARLQSPTAPSPGPSTHGRQNPEKQEATSSEEAPATGKLLVKVYQCSLSLPDRYPPGLLGSCCSREHRDVDPRRPDAWLASLFPRWVLRARSSWRIILWAHETTDLTGSRLCFPLTHI